MVVRKRAGLVTPQVKNCEYKLQEQSKQIIIYYIIIIDFVILMSFHVNHFITVFMPLPTDRCVGGIMFLGCPSASASVRASI